MNRTSKKLPSHPSNNLDRAIPRCVRPEHRRDMVTIARALNFTPTGFRRALGYLRSNHLPPETMLGLFRHLLA